MREAFSAYLDGTMSGVEMQSMAGHMDGCADCATEFAELRSMQQALGRCNPRGAAKAPEGLQARLRMALSIERERGTHLAWHQRLAAAWQETLRPIAVRAMAGTAAALVLVGGVSLLWLGSPTAVQANDEPLGAMTAPHYLYSDVPAQSIEFGHEVPILVEAKIDEEGRVYDYTIVSGPTDPSVERQPAGEPAGQRVSVRRRCLGVPVPGHVMMTYSGISVRG